MRELIKRNEVIKIIERRTENTGIPMMMCDWWGKGLYEQYGAKLDNLSRDYENDIYVGFYCQPGFTDSSTATPAYRWGFKDYSGATGHGINDNVDLLNDWDELDAFLIDFPDPNEKGIFDRLEKGLEAAKKKDKYCVGAWWSVFHEKFWTFRGMENLMMDYFDSMDGIKAIGRKLLEFYKVIIDRYSKMGFDAIFTSDDLGHQTGPMMSPDIFKELYFPLYKEFIAYVHSKKMHVILHSCGDNTKLMPYLIDAGLDVFHPVQPGCMDAAETAQNFGDKISFLAGLDVQSLIPFGTVTEVEAGINKMLSTLYKPGGGLLAAAGNGIQPNTPLENIEMFLKTVKNFQGATIT